MGRLRDGYDAPYWRSVNEEVIDLFGNEDGFLHRFDEDLSEHSRDPVWDEPAEHAVHVPYRMAYIIQDFTTPVEVSDDGKEDIYEATIFLSRAHLDKAGVPKDNEGEQVRPGDIFETFTRGDRLFWDIIGVDRQGFVNDSDYWTQLIITARRTSKFVPERIL